jgi:hypothetical protein
LPATPTGNFLSCGRRGYDTLCDSGDVNRGNCVVLAFSTPTSIPAVLLATSGWVESPVCHGRYQPVRSFMAATSREWSWPLGAFSSETEPASGRAMDGIAVGHAPHNAVACSDGAPHCRCRPTRGRQLCVRSDRGGQGEVKGCTQPRIGEEPQTAAMRLNDRATLIG